MIEHGRNHEHSDSFVILNKCTVNHLHQCSSNDCLQLISLPLHDPALIIIQQGQRGQIALHT